MKKIIISILGIFIAALALFAATQWNIQTDKAIIKFVMPAEEAEGTFSGLKATFVFDENDLTNSKITASVEVNTINSKEPDRDKHLCEADFFDAKKYSQITFASDSIKKNDSSFVAIGQLKIKETVKQIEIPFTLETKENEIIFKGRFEVFTSDFGVTKKPKDEKEIGQDKVIVEMEVPISK